MLTNVCIHTELYLTLSNDVDDKIDDAQHILITDLNQSNGNTIICWINPSKILGRAKWYHQFIGSNKSTEIPKDEEYLGWYTELGVISQNPLLKLLRKEDTVAVEGVFICNASQSNNYMYVSVGIHYASES